MIYALAASFLIVVFGVGVFIYRNSLDEPRITPTPESWRAADRLLEEVGECRNET